MPQWEFRGRVLAEGEEGNEPVPRLEVRLLGSNEPGRAGQMLDWAYTDEPVLVIHRLCVHPDAQRQGVAAQFMDFAEGRMKKKVMGAQEALDQGVKRVIFASANVERPVTSARSGKGTVIE